jgi:hypothetical protein
MLKFLSELAKHSATTKMTAQNLALIFTPSLFADDPHTADDLSATLGRNRHLGNFALFLIKNYSAVFKRDATLGEVRPSATLSAKDMAMALGGHAAGRRSSSSFHASSSTARTTQRPPEADPFHGDAVGHGTAPPRLSKESGSVYSLRTPVTLPPAAALSDPLEAEALHVLGSPEMAEGVSDDEEDDNSGNDGSGAESSTVAVADNMERNNAAVRTVLPRGAVAPPAAISPPKLTLTLADEPQSSASQERASPQQTPPSTTDVCDHSPAFPALLRGDSNELVRPGSAGDGSSGRSSPRPPPLISVSGVTLGSPKTGSSASLRTIRHHSTTTVARLLFGSGLAYVLPQAYAPRQVPHCESRRKQSLSPTASQREAPSMSRFSFDLNSNSRGRPQYSSPTLDPSSAASPRASLSGAVLHRRSSPMDLTQPATAAHVGVDTPPMSPLSLQQQGAAGLGQKEAEDEQYGDDLGREAPREAPREAMWVAGVSSLPPDPTDPNLDAVLCRAIAAEAKHLTKASAFVCGGMALFCFPKKGRVGWLIVRHSHPCFISTGD